MPNHPVHIIGASGRSGLALSRALLATGRPIVPVVRNAARWAEGGQAVPPRIADLTGHASLAEALADATAIVSCAHARHAASVIAAAPPRARLVFLGSTRKFTRWRDDHGNGVLAGEAAFLASARDGVMLHPTMIYGAQGENNVLRLAALLRRLPVLPLPNGGTALVQPIHQDDVTRAILAALARGWDGPHSVVVAGPMPLCYADFIRAIAAAAGLRPPGILRFPAAPLIAAAGLTRFLPGLPTIGAAEIRRLLEDKAFDIAPMQSLLGFTPISLSEGLARTFGRFGVGAGPNGM
jgi:nucleoside-diphosphate-sugar epimerase